MDAGSLEANKAVVRRLYERILNGRDLAAVDELFAEDYVGSRAGRMGVRGRDALRRSLAGLPALFGDARWELDDLIAEGDRVVACWTGRGTHAGEIQGVPATGKPVTITGITVHRLVGGKIASMAAVEDWLGALRQVGVSLTPPAAAGPDR
jgi:steroid delta-isomerase-like uncharacterized protein